MSGSQSTVTDRFPKKPIRTGSILKDHPPDKKPKSEKLSHEFDPTGLVQRCVIIQKDENGFGLTVSGDNPVFVQHVKEGGAAMRAGVQTGDRIIKVNGTLVTHSNHVEVVKLIKSGSYVALTVLGRPPGLPQIPLSEDDGESTPLSSLSSPLSPGLIAAERSPSSSTSSSDRITSPPPGWTMKEEHNRNPTPKLLKDSQEAQKHIPALPGQLSKVSTVGQDGLLSPMPEEGYLDERGGSGDVSPSLAWQSDSSTDPTWNNMTMVPPNLIPESPYQRDTPYNSPKTTPRISLNSCPSPDADDTPDLDSNSQNSVGSPSSRVPPLIIGAEDDDFDTEQEQMNGQCSCFQTIELLKSRPAHLAAFLHHVVSQFDPAPLLCYLYTEFYRQSNPKDTRRIFSELHTFFMDRSAHLKVTVPDSILADLDRRKPDLIPEDIQRQYVQQLQDILLPDIQKHLEDFRQKRSMGLTLAEADLSRLDAESVRDRGTLEKERSCAEQIILKIDEVLWMPPATDDEKCNIMQFVIGTFMKYLGVKVKELRWLEPKPKRINFLPKIKIANKTVKTEKDAGAEEKLKKHRFPIMRVPHRRPTRNDLLIITKVLDQNKPWAQKQPSLSTSGSADLTEAASSGRTRSNPSMEGPDSNMAIMSPSPLSAPPTLSSDSTSREPDPGCATLSALPRLSETGLPAEGQDSAPSSPTVLEHLQEEEPELVAPRNPEGGTPRLARRMDPPSLGEVQSEDDQVFEAEAEQDPPHWQMLVSTDVLAQLPPHEIKRQEVINELFYTERAHLRMLKVLDNVFYQRMTKETILPPADTKNIFTNLEEIVQLHVSITEQMMTIRKRNETAVVDLIGDDLLLWFSGTEEEKIKQAVGTFCSNQPFALEFIKSRQKKDQRFAAFVQEAEGNRQCRRLQLKDIIPVEMQRFTKYPLLLENIAKFTEDAEEQRKVKQAAECCRKILKQVNQEVKEAENKQRLEDYQKRLDLSSLKQSEYPMITEFKNLDLTKRKMVHEGPLSWKVNKDKTIELYTLLLEDILVLLQRQDEKLILKCHSKNLAGTAETKHIFSPIIKLSTVMVRSVATDNKSFFVLSMSDNGAQIYELMAQTVSEQKTWQDLIAQMAASMKSKQLNIITLPQTDGDRNAVEMINSTVLKTNKDPDLISTGSTQSPEKDDLCAEIMPSAPVGTNPFESTSEDENEEEAEGECEVEVAGDEENSLQTQDEDDEAFLEVSLGDRLSFLKQRTRHAIAVEEQHSDAFNLPPLMADEALRTLATLRQLLTNHMDCQEGRERDHERVEDRVNELGIDPLHSSQDITVSSSSVDNNAEHSEAEPVRLDSPHELQSRDAEFFESAEDYVGSYMVLEGYGGSAESSTDDDGIDLKKLLSSSSTDSKGPNLSRQIMTHLRLLQANLQHLKNVEIKYSQLCQRHTEEAATESEENQDKT